MVSKVRQIELIERYGKLNKKQCQDRLIDIDHKIEQVSWQSPSKYTFIKIKSDLKEYERLLNGNPTLN